MADISKIKTVNGATYDIKDAIARRVMTGATAQSNGSSGQVPAPSFSDVSKFLRGDGTWQTVSTEANSTLRVVPFSIATNGWTNSNNVYTATISSSYVTNASIDFVIFDETKRLFLDDISTIKASGGGGIVFSTKKIPAGQISGNIYIVDNDDGKIHMIVENTVMPIINGGTGANTMLGAQTNLGIVYSGNEPSNPVTGMIWLKPTE